MSRTIVPRKQLLERWGRIEEEEQESEESDSFTLRRLNQCKEEWFADAFNFLISLPKETHIWCDSWDVMGPLLETFYNYFKDERDDSPLRLLWKRISDEMRHCVQCISQHHQAQEMYDTEYESTSVGPLLGVLRSLDEERVTLHLQEINLKLARGKYDPQHDNAEVVSVMYEVLMFPILLDDQSLCAEFEKFIESVDNMHELALAGNQEFPGVYALLFLNRRVRMVGYRLAKSMGKMRRAADLEPLQLLLQKFIAFLETDGLQYASQSSRPRMHLDRSSIWLGITSLLEFLEPPTFEDGILERYPIFFDIVLNHISGDSSEFSQAVNCLKELFKMLGCKLWLRSTLSASVMRNTLLGQCFHTRNEKIHKSIFDLFEPFLQSLEALQDGEHEKQRRHFLYFLLHQVPVSSNFSVLTRKIGCKIALLIILRGYQMNPPCPPFECSHMWGPALVSSLKDSSLRISLRQPAFDLIQAIMVSDAASLMAAFLNHSLPTKFNTTICIEANDDEEKTGIQFSRITEESDVSSWSEFSAQSKITLGECKVWMCIPMLWIDVLADITPLVLPLSFSKAVFWARSLFCLVEPENSVEMALDVKSWLSSSAVEISPALGWKAPTGADDGGGGKESKNSIRVSTMCFPLIKMFKRLTTHFLVEMGQGELRKQWTWEPRMGESLVLSLLDPNDNMRQLGKVLLEQVSNTRGLTCGLKYLCSDRLCISAVFIGVRHALKQAQIDSVLLNFHALHHLLFLLCKLLKEDNVPNPDRAKKAYEGGFLRQPAFDVLPRDFEKKSSDVGPELLEEFCYRLSEVAWNPVKKCLVEGKSFLNEKPCQMTCIRVLEILPVLLGRLLPPEQSECARPSKDVSDFRWLHDLIDWGRSQLQVVIVYWKRTLAALLDLLKGYHTNASASASASVRAIENILSTEGIDMERLTEQVSRLCVSLSKEGSSRVSKATLVSQAISSEGLPGDRKCVASAVQSSSEDSDIEILESVAPPNRTDKNFGVLSEDKPHKQVLDDFPTRSRVKACQPVERSKTVASGRKSASHVGAAKRSASSRDAFKGLLGIFQQSDDAGGSFLASENLDKLEAKPPDHDKSSIFEMGKEMSRLDSEENSKNSVALKSVRSQTVAEASTNAVSTASQKVPKEVVCRAEEDLLESAFKSVKSQHSLLVKPGLFVPKRQVIQLKSPVERRADHLQRFGAGFKRFTPPRLDDWYRQILELDYFATVGLSETDKDQNQNSSKLKEVPVFFQSPEQYTNIFQPLVLEEFKAQLHSSFLETSSWEEMYCGNLSVISVERVDDFHLVRFVHDDNDSSNSRSFSENDLVLLTKEPPQKSTHGIHMIGKVERRERDEKRKSSILLIKFHLQNGSTRLNQARKNLLERSKWNASRILNITSQIREFQALSSVKGIPLLPVILNPVSDCGQYQAKKSDLTKLSQPLQSILKSSFNESQLQAISAAIKSPNATKDYELSLIQGPPGTGKTRTIVAIVSSLLASLSHRITSTGTIQSHGLSAARQKMGQSAAIARAWQDAALAKQLNDDVNKYENSEAFARGRVLICAQSNAAVDELVSRISSAGLYGRDGKMYKPYLVRVGNAKTVHSDSLPFFIDTLVDQRLAEERMQLNDAKSKTVVGSSSELRSNLEKLADHIRFYEAKRANIRNEGSDFKNLEDECHEGDAKKEMSEAELNVKLRRLYDQKRQIYKDLSVAQAQERKANDEIRALRHKLRRTVLREAQIVVTTLSGCGGDLYGVCAESISSHRFGTPSENTLFDAVVIDEAAQALEPATLIPLQLLKSRGTKCIMVGDPKQLPATVLSNVASKFLYECSMFERLQKACYPVFMLTQQYRMHPEISRFPSLHFYDNKLLDGERMSTKSAPFHETRGLGPYVFYDIVDGHELRSRNSGAMSLYNEQEADAAVQLLKFFKKTHPSEFVPGRIGIITPYKCQLSILRSRFSNAFGSTNVADMELNTVDGFQGREVDILILSTVRASESSASHGINSSSIGFVADVRRMNVALTRARFALWILGNARTLQTNRNWAALVKNAKERNLVVSIKRPYSSSFGRSASTTESPEHLLEQPRSSRDSSSWPNKQKKDKTNAKVGAKADNMGMASKRCPAAEDETNFSSKKRDFRDSKKRARREHDSQMKKDNSVVTQSAEKSPKEGVQSARFKEHALESEKKGKTKGKDRSTEKPDSDQIRKKNHSEQHHEDSNLVSNKQKPSKKSIPPERNKKDPEASKGESMQKGDHGGTSNQLGASESLIAKRKRQREAVDAILCSSLLPSKRPSESSSKPVPPNGLPLSSSRGGGNIKPPKARKDIPK